MLGSPILDVAIGMAFIFLTLSLIASAIQEILSSLVQTRAANLFNGIRSLFSGNTDLLEKLYTHGIIAGLYKDPPHDFGGAGASVFPWLREALQPLLGIRLIPVSSERLKALDPLLLPAYIPPRAFAVSMIDILNPDNLPADNNMMAGVVIRLKGELKKCREEQSDGRAYSALLSLALRAGSDVTKFQKGLENWYSDAMDRVSGWYKKYTQDVLLVIGLVLAIAFNVDSIRLCSTLWTNRDARQALVASATTFLQKNRGSLNAPAEKKQAGITSLSPNAQPAEKDGNATSTKLDAAALANSTSVAAPNSETTATDPSASAEELDARLSHTLQTFNQINQQMMLPIGWHHSIWGYAKEIRREPAQVLWALLGWIITAIALSYGAPFWFDTLNKFMIVRSTVKPQEKSQTDKSKDG